MSKINLGVIFGGMSTENEVSVVSGTSVVRNLDKEKYNIFQKMGNGLELRIFLKTQKMVMY